MGQLWLLLGHGPARSLQRHLENDLICTRYYIVGQNFCACKQSNSRKLKPSKVIKAGKNITHHSSERFIFG